MPTPLFKPGNPGGGRKKGSKNKLTTAREIFEKIGLNPLKEAVAEIAKVTDPKERAKLLLELCKFVFPTAKEVKLEVENEGLVIIMPEKKEEPKKEP